MISFIKSSKSKLDYPVSDNEIVLVGKSNVGKSSLINALFGKVAYVGKTPGKTRMLNFYNVDNKFTVCDVPGYGFANRSQDELIEFGNIMEEYFDTRKCIKLCLFVVDIRREFSDDDLDMLEFIRDRKLKMLLIANKIDKLPKYQVNINLDSLSSSANIPKDKIVCVSCKDKININLLKSII